jgi:hypothetical protein
MDSAPCDVRRQLLASAVRGRVSVSRMLEICMSGSMRGRDSSPSLLDYASVFYNRGDERRVPLTLVVHVLAARPCVTPARCVRVW